MQKQTNSQLIESANPVQQGVLVYLFKLYEKRHIASLVLLRRAKDQRKSIISGKIKSGETPLYAAIRQVREDTGNYPVIITDTGLKEYIQCQRHTLHARIFTGIIAHDINITLNHEHTGYEFVPVPIADQQLNYPEQKAHFEESWKAALTLLSPIDALASAIFDGPPNYLKNSTDNETVIPCQPARIVAYNEQSQQITS